MKNKDTKNEYATIGFYGKETKLRFKNLMNQYKNLYSTVHQNTPKITTADILEGLCDLLEQDINIMEQEFSKKLLEQNGNMETNTKL